MKSSPTPVWEDNNLEGKSQRVLNFARPAVLGSNTVVRVTIKAGDSVVGTDNATQIQLIVHTNESLSVSAELNFVKGVEKLHAELHSDSLRQLKVLVDREIGVGDSRPKAISNR